MADTTEKVNIIAVPPDTSPLIPESKEEHNEPLDSPPVKESHDDLQLPEALIRPNYSSEPEAIQYRWFILASCALAIAISAAMSSFYNSLEVLLVDVRIAINSARCSNCRFLPSIPSTWSTSFFMSR